MGSNQSHEQLVEQQQHQRAGSSASSSSAAAGASAGALTASKRHSLGSALGASMQESGGKKAAAKRSSAAKSQCASKQTTMLTVADSEISDLERRRKSIQDGDVFIYPSLYKDLNECQKCERDNKICDCVTRAVADTAIQVSSGNSQQGKSPSRQKPRAVSFVVVGQQQQQPVREAAAGSCRHSSYSHDVERQEAADRSSTTSREALAERKDNDDNINGKQTQQTTAECMDAVYRLAAIDQRERDANPSSFRPPSQQAADGKQIVVGSSSPHLSAADPDGSGCCDQVATRQQQQQQKQKHQRRSLENVLKDEGENEEQLTCCNSGAINDSFKITTTSIRIGGAHLTNHYTKQQSQDSDCQHTSIVPIQTLSTRRKNMCAIAQLKQQQPSADNISASDSFSSSAEDSNLIARLSAMPGTPPATADGGGSSSATSDILDYSPILTGVRDYINTVNTEIQVQTSTVSGAIGGPSLPVGRELVSLPASLDGDQSALASIVQITSDQLASSQQPNQVVPSHLMDECTMRLSENKTSDAQPIANVMQVTNFATNASVASLVPVSGLESPKKSIFDGASKDEILEYLEDARERVPEILMAADDVLVISENELIVVNQLESGSPATPISIVETTEMVASSPASVVSATAAITSPGELIQQIYQQSSVAQFGCSQMLTTSSNSTLDGQSPETVTTVATACNDDPSINAQVIDRLSAKRMSLQDSRDSKSADVDGNNRIGKLDEMPGVKLLTITGANELESDTAMTNHHYASSAGIYVRRRNSTSSDGSGGQVSCDRALRMMRLHQQRYNSLSKRDSLSSPPSSPQSSASPTSSTTSSNQNTSGNCSVASTFYASSSISCSSPFLAPALSSHTGANLATIGALPSTADINSNEQPGQLSSEVTTNHSAAQLFDLLRGGDGATMTKESASRAADSVAPSGLLRSTDRDDSGLGVDAATLGTKPAVAAHYSEDKSLELTIADVDRALLGGRRDSEMDQSLVSSAMTSSSGAKLSVIDECRKDPETNRHDAKSTVRFNTSQHVNVTPAPAQQAPTFSSSANLMSRTLHGHYATMSRLNNYFMNRHPLSAESATAATIVTASTVEFQCLDCDQLIDVDHAKMMSKSNEIRQLRGDSASQLADERSVAINKVKIQHDASNKEAKLLTPEQLDRAYIAAMNGLPLCKGCEKKRIERKEIISEFVETELKYGHDLRIIYDEFYRPMQIAGLLVKDQISGVFLNLEELIMAHCKFAGKLQAALNEAHSMGDVDYNTVNIGRLFVESAEMLSTYEYYCIRQGPAACLLARLAKEKELLRIFLRVSQMENTLLRRMNLAAFLMVPVQRVTKYPLLLNRLYKVTAYYHKDREALRDAQLRVELHLEHINQQTKGAGATNKIWRRISNLSAPISSRRCLINAEDLGYIKLRKTAMDMLKWDRDDTQFIHSGKLHFAPLNEFLTKQKMKPIRYIASHALLIVLGKPNWKYRPDLVKSNLDSKLMTPTPGGNGIKETALLLFREKNGRFVPCREPLFLSNCVLSADCSQYNIECSSQPTSTGTNPNPTNHNHQSAANGAVVGQVQQSTGKSTQTVGSLASSTSGGRKLASTASDECSFAAAKDTRQQQQHETRSASTGSNGLVILPATNAKKATGGQSQAGHSADAISRSSIKSLPENQTTASGKRATIDSQQDTSLPLSHTTSARSYSLTSTLTMHGAQIPLVNSTVASNGGANLTKSSSIASSNMTIINQLRSKVNNYHKQSAHNGHVKASDSSSPATGKAAATTNQSAQVTANEASTNHDVNSISDSTIKGKSITSDASSVTHLSSETTTTTTTIQHHYNHHFFHNHHQPYGDYEESFEIHERLTKESMLLRADTPLKTRYWLQMLRYHAKDLGQWRTRRNALANIMMMRHE